MVGFCMLLMEINLASPLRMPVALGRTRYIIVMIFALVLYAVPVKILLRLALNVKYVLITPWFNI